MLCVIKSILILQSIHFVVFILNFLFVFSVPQWFRCFFQ